MSGKTKQVQIRATKDTHAKVAELSESYDKPMQVILQMAVDAYFETLKQSGGVMKVLPKSKKARPAQAQGFCAGKLHCNSPCGSGFNVDRDRQTTY